jgi:hypothetical protein
MRSLPVFLVSCLLCGCAEVAALFISTAATSVVISAVPVPAGAGSPRVLCATPDSIAVEYDSASDGSERVAALQLIAGHCDGDYVETRRSEADGRWILEARCGGFPDSGASHCAESL